MTYKKIPQALEIGPGEKLTVVIALGYGVTSGEAHRSKKPEQVSSVSGPAPQWFQKGVEAALLAPTAMNQQKFKFTLDGSQVEAKAGIGFYSKIDLGIVKYHFEQGAGKDRFTWR